MHKRISGSSLRCVLLGHTNGSVVVARNEIAEAKTLIGKTFGIPHAQSTHKILLFNYLKTPG